MSGRKKKENVSEGLKTPKLTKRQQRFVEAVADPNVKSNAEAARRAGYSPKTAGEIAKENLQKPYIFEAIEKRKARLAELARVTDEHILGATAEIAFSSIEDALDDSGYFDFKKAKQNGSVALIKKITRNPTKYGETVAIEFYPKDAAQARLGEYKGMKQQERTNEQDADLLRIKSAIESRAKDKGVDYAEELKNFVANYAEIVRPEIKEKLASELVN